MSRSSDHDDDLVEEPVTRVLPLAPRPVDSSLALPTDDPQRREPDAAGGVTEPAAQSGAATKAGRADSTKMAVFFVLGLLLGATLTGAAYLLMSRMGQKPAEDRPAEENQAAALPPKFTNSLGMEFTLVPKGKSWLGGGRGTPGDKEVEIGHDFYLGVYEVTQEEWEKVTGLSPSHFSRSGGGKDAVKDISDADLKRFPVEKVSWNDAQAFLARLNQRDEQAGWIYRLPTEVEWEYACRGGPLRDRAESAFDFYLQKPSNELRPDQANITSAQSLKRPSKVGSYAPNRLGLYDMHGNVWEWCDDAEKNAKGPLLRTHRGGGWIHVAANCRAAYRFAQQSTDRDFNRGLRLARVPAGKDLVKLAAPEPLEELERKEKKKLDEAIASFRNAIELDPKSAKAHNRLGQALRTQGKLDAAIACHRKAIELDPKSASAHNNLGYALEAQGKLDEAIACYRRSIELDPPATWAWWPWQCLGWSQYRAGNWKASLQALEESCKLQKGGDCGQWIVMSLVHWKLANEKELPEEERARHKAEARRRYDQSVKQIDSWGAGGDAVQQAIRAFRTEAAGLLGVKEKHSSEGNNRQ